MSAEVGGRNGFSASAVLVRKQALSSNSSAGVDGGTEILYPQLINLVK